MLFLQVRKRKAKIRKAREKVAASVTGGAPICIVYQMGKVASTSIYEALKDRTDCFGFHTHSLNRANIDKNRSHQGDEAFAIDKRGQLSDQLSAKIVEPRLPVKIITLVRDPFERNISAYFENNRAIRKGFQLNQENLKKLIDDFLNNSNHLGPQRWFENEFEPALGVDIFAHPFDPVSEWGIIRQAPYDILVLRTTLDDSKKSELISDFLELPGVNIERRNSTTDKSLKKLYQEFKNTVVFPEDLGQQILECRYTQHFFTAAEIERMKSRWVTGA